MKKYFILLPVLVLIITGFTASVYAMDMDHSKPELNLGQHIAAMAPEHPKVHGVVFGNMVSNIARRIPCSH